MKIKYGDIETDVIWKVPTKEIFESWKRDFFKLEDVELFDVYLVGGFLEKLYGKTKYTEDVDIILTGCDNRKKIENLIYEGTKFGLEKYQIFFDVLWFDNLPLYYKMKNDEVKNIKIYLLSDKWVVDGKVKKQYNNAKQIGKNLWEMNCSFPTYKQKQKINDGYVYLKPMLINGSLE